MESNERLNDFVATHGDEDTVLYHGFEDCVVGMAERFGTGQVLVYDRDKILEKLQTEGLTEEEAWEHYGFNILGGWVGDGTPIFLTQHFAKPTE